MAIKSLEQLRKRGIEVDLSGPQGNVFYLMGLAQRLCDQIGKDATPILEDMQSSNYAHAIEAFEREFGGVVTLYR